MTKAAWLLVLASMALLASAIAHDRERDQLLIDPVEQATTSTVSPADFPVCVTARPPSLLQPPPRNNYDYRLDPGHKDGGTT